MRYFLYICVSFFLCGIFLPYTYAGQELPDDFKPECFKYYDRVEDFLIQTGQSYKLDINKDNFLLVQWWKYLYYNPIVSQDVVVETQNEYADINDKNPKTFLEIDSSQEKEFTLDLDKKLLPHEFLFLYDIDVRYHTFEFWVSLNDRDYFLVTDKTIYDFPFQYFKIKFIPLNPNKDIRESIKIKELMFVSSRKDYSFIAEEDNVLEVYSQYSCTSKFIPKPVASQNIPIDVNTPIIYATLSPNPKFNTYVLQDRDNDWVEDSVDNCPYHYNPDQKDNNSDNVWNVCSDVDGDGIIGYKDICPETYNPSQYDVNTNGIGDACEFDKDQDGIFDSIDNCITISNPEQTDTDKDGIGDMCDNCKYFNIKQLDVDQNGVWDVCDQKAETLRENDQDNDGILDWSDNCKDTPNAYQEDKDKDNVGDACDNCVLVKNTDQVDKNENDVWDMCEDGDQDGFIGYQDNCIYVPNADQADSDNNGVGNLCEDGDGDAKIYAQDNCPYVYNPDQIDIDNDGIGDKCDESDDRFIESNKTFFIIFLVFIALIFGFWIFSMYKKLR